MKISRGYGGLTQGRHSKRERTIAQFSVFASNALITSQLCVFFLLRVAVHVCARFFFCVCSRGCCIAQSCSQRKINSRRFVTLVYRGCSINHCLKTFSFSVVFASFQRDIQVTEIAVVLCNPYYCRRWLKLQGSLHYKPAFTVWWSNAHCSHCNYVIRRLTSPYQLYVQRCDLSRWPMFIVFWLALTSHVVAHAFCLTWLLKTVLIFYVIRG